MQPALGMGDHGNRVAGTADRKAFGLQLVDQGLNLGLFAHHEFDIGTNGEADIAFSEFVGDVRQFTDGVDIHLTLGSGTDSPDTVTALSDMMQNTGTRALVPSPLAIVLLQDGVQIGLHLRDATLNRHTRFRHAYLQKNRVFDSFLGATGMNPVPP